MPPQLLLRRFPGAHFCRHQGNGHRRRLSSESEAAGSPHYGGDRRRQHEEEGKAVKVSVWWDFENCHVCMLELMVIVRIHIVYTVLSNVLV